ncbi:hypothetical protein TB1_026561 [Malus domestica]
MSKDVTKEVNLLKKVNHFNLISLLGACEHGGDLYLMYEFMENGSLRDWIKKNSCPEVQSWDCRVQMALDIANGLHYLHNFTGPAYVHKDLSSTKLNKNLRAKIANFSLARSAENQSNENSSMRYARVPKGYMAPEYIEYRLDGVEVLLSDTSSRTMGGENAEAQPDGLIDPNFNVEHCAEFTVRMIKLSLECLAQEPENRPRIHQVL